MNSQTNQLQATKVSELTKPEDISQVGEKFSHKGKVYQVAAYPICTGCHTCAAFNNDQLCGSLPHCARMAQGGQFTEPVVFREVP